MAKDAERLAAQAERIAELRATMRVTQPDVADAVGVTLRAYQAWEAGDSDPKGPNIKALADYFGTTPDYIEFGRSPATTPDRLLLTGDGNEPLAILERIESKLDLLLRALAPTTREQADYLGQALRTAGAALAQGQSLRAPARRARGRRAQASADDA